MTRSRRPGRERAGILEIGLFIVMFLPGCAIIERVTHDPWMSFALKVINFLILLVILIKFLSKPLGNFLKNRQVRLRQALEDAEKARAEAEKKLQDYEKRLVNIDKEIEEIHHMLREEGEREKARILGQAEELAEKIREQARVTAQQEIRIAQGILREEVADLAVKLARQILEKGMTEADQKKLIEDYVDRIETLR
jgi:F-type H+-transporting ATPase subunit b